MSDELDEVRREVAASRGLPDEALSFLDGATVEEVEAAAGRLADLLRASSSQEQEQADPLAGLFADAAGVKARRQRALFATLHGSPRQPRDPDGKYAGFDGGARLTVPPPQSPEREHDELVAEMSRLSRTFGASV